MRRVQVFAVFMFVVQAATLNTHAAQTDWAAVLKEVGRSVVAIQRDDHGTSCTGFVIHTKAKFEDETDVDNIATASHCEASKLWADQSEARIRSKTKEKDLIVLVVEDTGRPALKLAAENPKVGDEVASLGYGYGLEKPLFRITHISAETYIPYEGIGGPLFMTDATFVPGQSGGPVVNSKGEVVMMVQMGTNSVGMGVGAETLKDKIGRHWEKPSAAKP